MIQFVEFLMSFFAIRTVAFVVPVKARIKVVNHRSNSVQLFLGKCNRTATVERLKQQLLGQFAHQSVLALNVRVTQLDGKEIEEVAGGLPVRLNKERSVSIIELL